MSPSDGKVLYFGKVDSGGQLEQVKGVTYQLQKFLGDGNALSESLRGNDEGYGDLSERHLYHVILYLAPGDYHHFHSPVDWNISTRRHFSGEVNLCVL